VSPSHPTAAPIIPSVGAKNLSPSPLFLLGISFGTITFAFALMVVRAAFFTRAAILALNVASATMWTIAGSVCLIILGLRAGKF
jgi:hypothetical protein